MSYQEIAEIKENPIWTVMPTLYYAKKKLRGIVRKLLGSE